MLIFLLCLLFYGKYGILKPVMNMQDTFMYKAKGRDPLYKTWHASDDNLLIYMHTDGGNIVLNDKIYAIKKGTLCFIASGCYHYTMPDFPEAYIRTKLFFSNAVLENIRTLLSGAPPLGCFCANAVYANLPDTIQKNTEFFLRELSSLYSAPQNDVLFMGTLLSLLSYMDIYAVESVSRSSTPLQKAIFFINNHITEEINIDAICSAIPMSKYHFCRQFKKTMGLTVMEYILQTRLTLAKNALRKESKSVSQISAECGFSSLSYFCRVFKEHTGLSPLCYRKNA